MLNISSRAMILTQLEHAYDVLQERKLETQETLEGDLAPADIKRVKQSLKDLQSKMDELCIVGEMIRRGLHCAPPRAIRGTCPCAKCEMETLLETLDEDPEDE